MKYLLHLFYIAILLLAVVACKPGIPSDVMSEGKMVDIMYDMHVAQAMSENADVMKNNKEVIALRSFVLSKHNVTPEEWEHSYNFYCAHAEYLYEIYQELSERMQQNVVALGGKVQGVEEEEADTANIWNREPNAILMVHAPYNRLSFSIDPDTTLHEGERISLQYEAQMMFQDGLRDLTVVMNVHYANDSICSRVDHVSSDGMRVLSVSNVSDSLKVKKITGFFMLAQNITDESSNDYNSTMRLVALRKIKLLHRKE